MSQSLIGLALETGGVLIKFTQTGAETGGSLHVQDARYPAHSPPAPLHRHPQQDERFVIVEGALKFRIGGTDRLVSAGESIEVPRATFHRAHNPGDVEMAKPPPFVQRILFGCLARFGRKVLER